MIPNANPNPTGRELEAARRRESLDVPRSVPVKMGDGVEWLLPKPWVEVHPVFENGKPVDRWLVFTYGPELDALVKAISEAEDAGVRILAAVGLGAHLLLRNYDLSDDELATVLVFRSGDPESEAMVRGILDVATGRTGPKPSRGGAA